MRKQRKLLAKYIGCSIVVTAKMGNTSVDGNRFCINDVKYGNSLVTDHLRLRGKTFKGKGDPLFLEITIYEYERADGTKDYGVKSYRHIPISVGMGRVSRNDQYRNKKRKVNSTRYR